MSVQDEKWFQELGETAAYNSNPEHEGLSFALNPEQVWKLIMEIERLNGLLADASPCGVCGHAYSDHHFNGANLTQHCMICLTKYDLHNFALAE